mgnify:CR=1 FL=1
MTDSASQTIAIDASLDDCFSVAADFGQYPEWVKDIKAAVVVARDDDGRPTQVEFRTSALGRSTHYTLAYDYTEAPKVLSWTMVKGDIMRAIEGAYRFEPLPSGGTEVRYDLSIELVVPLPGFVKRRAEVRILNSIRDLKARVEG